MTPETLFRSEFSYLKTRHYLIANKKEIVDMKRNVLGVTMLRAIYLFGFKVNYFACKR